MNKLLLFTFIALICGHSHAQKMKANKKAVISAVEVQEESLIELSDAIWAHAEIAFQENESSKLLADHAEENGFKVERGVAGMPTAFVATYGSGKPVISILGEFDALPGISQKAKPTKDPLVPGGAGHGCGHNLFGTGSLGAAIAVKDLIEEGRISGTIKFFGTPAEEKFFWQDLDG